jgi:hypothetical protein
VRFASFNTPLSVNVSGGKGTAFGCFYDETDPGWPDDANLVYLVSFHGEPSPRLVQASDISGHWIGLA